MMKTSQYICPICQQALTLNNKSFSCTNNHSFDQAKEGYVNLLPVQHKHSKDPGDNKEMVNARRSFLESGFYQPLQDRLVELKNRYAVAGNILDAGCGEGYYTNAHESEQHQVYGVDIAKNAVKIAAKKYKQCHFSVGSIAQLPFADEFFDWLFSIYAPIKTEEFSRLLKNEGYLLTVTPGEKHLWELKQMIYQTPKYHNIDKQQLDGFELVAEENINYQMNFERGEQALTLLAMTPFAFKSSEQLVTALRQAINFTCQVDFMVRIYKKA
ncbi:23S rRNA (guanine(745)-N(1))-methyltransferase [Thalassotalea psychrophila]|uniref:23S rRNA (Guanine(745)-N(1))-methyltransferase n=1 Tax=Thalassotalea psychrophila TaxID=3065647 RepID=A0ABY9TYW4_9GAMM|nr:23S rRNA (guanine(745)-N(1))-methyltransferase [Colwelliaceae bacterium SQ149]